MKRQKEIYSTVFKLKIDLNKTFQILMILFLSLACQEDRKTESKLTNQFKLEFLNDILSDTTDLRILSSKSQLVSNYPYIVPPHLPINPINQQKSISHVKFISEALQVLDTMFVKNQIMNNEALDLSELSSYGFNVFDLKSRIEDEVPYNDILDEIDSLNKGMENYSLLKISKPVFNEKGSLVYIRIEQGSGGSSYILENKNGKWSKKYHLEMWVE